MTRLVLLLCILPAACEVTSVAACEGATCEEDAASSSWLQVASQVSKENEPTSSRPDELLRSALPLAWMHIPKTGTSMANALTHLPGTCPGIAMDFTVDRARYGIDYESKFWNSTCLQSCPGLHCWEGDHHRAIGPDYDTLYRGHAVAMFRQPAQRMISEYHMFYEDYFPELGAKVTPREAAVMNQGMATRMLTHPTATATPPACLPPLCTFTADKIALAKKRLREGFVFIGITDQWDLSICLLHTMFGGQCYGVEFLNARPGIDFSDDPYDESILEGFVDSADEEVYQEALIIFNENLEKYNVSHESCGPCWEEAAATMPARSD